MAVTPGNRRNRQNLTNIQTKQRELIRAEQDLYNCGVIGQACFAAGTRLLSPTGPKAIEEFAVGDAITSRHESEPGGALEVKTVEAVFRRTAPILNLHVGGQVIRTTGEHPFFAYDKGWVKAATLELGDRLLCADGQWVAVEEVLDTGEWEVVYNLRVSDFHTYFVCDWDWGFAVWSHNTYYYHGTSKASAASIATSGVNLSSSRANLDFGPGFYTTTIISQAQDLARGRFGSNAAVVSINVSSLSGLVHLDFGTTVTDSWKDTVWKGRQGELAQTPLNADVVSGPVLRNPPNVPGGMTSSAEATAYPVSTHYQTVWITNAGVARINSSTRQVAWEA